MPITSCSVIIFTWLCINLINYVVTIPNCLSQKPFYLLIFKKNFILNYFDIDWALFLQTDQQNKNLFEQYSFLDTCDPSKKVKSIFIIISF